MADIQLIQKALKEASEQLLTHPNIEKFDIWWIRTMLARQMKFILPEGEYWRLITTHTDMVRTEAERYALDILKRRAENKP